MPPATQYWTIEPDRKLAEAANQERVSRRKVIETNQAQYDGNHPKPLKVRMDSADNNVIINLDGGAIDEIIAFAIPSFPDLDLGAKGVSQPEQWLREAWLSNDGAALLRDFMLFGSLAGQVYVRILPPDADHEYPTLQSIDSEDIITYWKADNKSVALWYEHIFTTDRKYKLDFVDLKQFGGSGWSIKQYFFQGNGWKFMSEQEWPYPLGPIVSWQHIRNPRSYYGKNAFVASLLNKSANKVASDISSILRNHASPKLVGKGVEPNQVA